jgi:hypothetical protein
MLRVVLTCLLLTLCMTSAARAEPISLAILGALSIQATATAVAITNFIVGVALSIGANLIASSLLAPDAQPRAALQGVSAEVKFGGKVAHEGAFGRVATKGQYIYWNTHGASNRYLDQVYVLSSGWCDGLDGLYLDGEAVALTQVGSGTGWTRYAVTLPDDNGTRRLWVTFWEGRHDQDASAALVATANPSDRWTSEHLLRGMAYAHVEADYDATMDSLRSLLGGNALLFVVKGLRLYDPRKDTTAGGSGSHRFDDWTTWEWSDNPAVCQYHFERGYFINGQRVLGMGVPVYDLVTPLYMAAANICDETVDTPDDGSEARYRVAMIVNDDAEYIDAVDGFVSAMAGQRVEREGMFGVIAGAAQVPVATISDDDILLDAPLVHTTRRRRDELINEVHGQYTDPENLWDGSTIEPVIGDASVKAADGGETRPVPKNLYQVTSPFQARRLLLIAFRLNRMQATASFSLGLDALEYELGDWLIWRGRTWAVSGWRLETATDRIALTLTETATSVYSVGEGDVGPVPLPPTPPATPNRPTNVSGFTLQAGTVEGEDGQAVPAILCGWDAVTDETIRTVEVEYRRVGETGAGERRSVTRPASGDWNGTTIAGGLMAATDYEARSTITTWPIRRTTWGEWAQITTQGNLVVPSAAGLYNAATAAVVPASETLGDLRSSIYEQLHRITTEAGIEGATVDRQLRETEATRAAFTTMTQLVATETNALASQLTSLTTTVGTNTATISTLSSSVDGLEGRWGVAIDINGGPAGGIALTGVLRNDGTVSSSLAIAVDTFVVGQLNDAGSWINPFIVESGTVYIDNAVIKDLTTDKIVGLEAYVETIAATEISAASITTDQLVVGGTAITAELIENGAVTPIRESGASGTVTITDNGTPSVANAVDASSSYPTLQTYTATDMLLKKPYSVHLEFTAGATCRNFAAFLMYRYGGSGDYIALTSVQIGNPSGLTAGTTYRILLALGIADQTSVDFKANATWLVAGAGNSTVSNCRIIVNQIAK